MKKYYKQLNESGEVVLLLTYDFAPTITDPLIVEISEEEYKTLLSELVANGGGETEPQLNEIALKAQAYDIITGVSE